MKAQMKVPCIITTAGGMYLENATSFLPNVNRFYMNGSYTTVARDQMPSVSAPNWGKVTCTIFQPHLQYLFRQALL